MRRGGRERRPGARRAGSPARGCTRRRPDGIMASASSGRGRIEAGAHLSSTGLIGSRPGSQRDASPVAALGTLGATRRANRRWRPMPGSRGRTTGSRHHLGTEPGSQVRPEHRRRRRMGRPAARARSRTPRFPDTPLSRSRPRRARPEQRPLEEHEHDHDRDRHQQRVGGGRAPVRGVEARSSPRRGSSRASRSRWSR